MLKLLLFDVGFGLLAGCVFLGFQFVVDLFSLVGWKIFHDLGFVSVRWFCCHS